jgi:hypothetical protein
MRLASFTARGLAGAGLLLLGASCGARSGLFGPLGDDVPSTRDGSVATTDATTDRDATTDAPPDATPCIPGQFDFELAAPQMMLVIDRSGSMKNGIDNDQPMPVGQPNRWTVLRDSLQAALAPFDTQIAIGAKFYPEAIEDDVAARFDGCIVDGANFVIAPQLKNSGAILEVFQTRLPNGGTPTSDAIKVAAGVLGARRGVARSIVVATDGAPNCNGALKAPACVCTSPQAGACDPNSMPSQEDANKNCLDDARTTATVKEIADVKKISVYVVGIGAEVNNAYQSTLNAMAVAGGQARPGPTRYYSARSAAELTSALASIRDSVASCTYLTPSAPTDPNAISVTVGGQSVPRDPTHQNGWDWVDQAYGQLQFYGAACTALSNDAGTGAMTVSGVVRCQ